MSHDRDDGGAATAARQPSPAPGTSPASAGGPTAIAVAAALALTWLAGALINVASAPWFRWNELRLACVAGLFEGYSLYPTREAGPILPWIYPPMSALLYLPAGRVESPAAAVAVGSAIAALCATLPAAWLHFARTRRERHGASLCWVAFASFGIFTVINYATHYSVYTIHTDAPALGAGALACGVLARALASDRAGIDRRDRDRRNRSPLVTPLSTIAIAAAWSAFAVACKQTMLPLIAVLALWLALDAGWRAAARYVALSIASLVAMLGAAGARLGFAGMWLNVVEVPRRHPLEWGRLDFTVDALLPAIPCLALLLFSLRRDRRGAASDGAPASIAGDLPWFPFALAAIALAPAALLARAKHGGDVNSYSLVLYFLAIAASLALPDLLAPSFVRPSPRSPLLRLTTLAALAALAADGLFTAWDYAAATLLSDAPPPITEALELERGHPGQVFFPHHPLVMLRVDGRLYHELHAVEDWRLAAIPTPPERLSPDLPHDGRAIAIRDFEELPDYFGPVTPIAPPFRAAPDWRFFATLAARTGGAPR